MRFWSEVPSARAREVAADVATWSWVSLWAVVAFRLYSTLAEFAEVGRAIERGGANIQAAGDQVGDSLGGLPLVGEQVRGLTRSAFGAAGEPFVFVGDQLEQLLLMIAALLGVLVLGVTLIPWLSRYLPWRARRLFELRTAYRAIHLAPRDVPEAAIEQAPGLTRAPPPHVWRAPRAHPPIRSGTSRRAGTTGWPVPSWRAFGLPG